MTGHQLDKTLCIEETPTEMGRDVRVVFTASKTFLGRWIRRLTQSKVSHAFLEYDSSLWGGRWAAEATISGVRKVPAAKARHHVVCQYRVRFDPRPGLRMIAPLFGSAYDVTGILVFAWAIMLWRWFRVRMRRFTRNTKSQLCSELVARFLIASQVTGTANWDPERTSPEQIRHLCARHEGEAFYAIPLGK